MRFDDMNPQQHQHPRGPRFGGPRHHHGAGFPGRDRGDHQRGGFGPGRGFGPGFGPASVPGSAVRASAAASAVAAATSVSRSSASSPRGRRTATP